MKTGRLLFELVAVMVAALGCAHGTQGEITNIGAEAAVILKCGPEKVSVVYARGQYSGFPWVASGCHEKAVCREVRGRILCYRPPPPLFAYDEVPEGFSGVAVAVSTETGCTAGDAQIVYATTLKERGGTVGFAARLCDRNFDCTSRVNRSADIVEESVCMETATSKEHTARKVAFDRLVIETGCPAANVQFVDQSEWVAGTERAYRLSACGKPYVCTTAAGRTECRRALADTPRPETPPAPVPFPQSATPSITL